MKQLAFEPLREIWGEYSLPDGVIVRARSQLVFVVSATDPQGQNLNVRFVTSVSSLSPEELHGDPSSVPVDFAKDAPARVYKEWSTVRPAECYYLLEGGLVVLFQLRLTEIRRFSKFSTDREPVIQVIAQTNIVISPSLTNLKAPEVVQAPPA